MKKYWDLDLVANLAIGAAFFSAAVAVLVYAGLISFNSEAEQKRFQENRQAAAEREIKLREEQCQSIVDYFVNEMIYVKDPRTGICYAYFWGGGGRGGPAIACVPEEKIPPNLLYVGKMPQR